MRINLRMIPRWVLVLHVCVPECSPNGSRMHHYLWVEEVVVPFRQSITITRDSVLLNSWYNFSDSAFNILENSCDMFLFNSRRLRVPKLAIPKKFVLSFPRNGCQLSLDCHCCHLLKGQMNNNDEDWFIFLILTNSRVKRDATPLWWKTSINY